MLPFSDSRKESKQKNWIIGVGEYLIEFTKDAEKSSEKLIPNATSEINLDSEKDKKLLSSAAEFLGDCIKDGAKVLLKPIKNTGEAFESAGKKIENGSKLAEALKESIEEKIEKLSNPKIEEVKTVNLKESLDQTWQNIQKFSVSIKDQAFKFVDRNTQKVQDNSKSATQDLSDAVSEALKNTAISDALGNQSNNSQQVNKTLPDKTQGNVGQVR